MVKSKYIIEKEIEVLNQSKDTNKFDYQTSINIYATLLVLMTSLVTIFGYKSSLQFIEIAYLWLFLFLLITLYQYFLKFRPIKNDFKIKNDLVRKKYKKLGVDVDSLERELRRASLE